jgi:hypothetical protein
VISEITFKNEPNKKVGPNAFQIAGRIEAGCFFWFFFMLADLQILQIYSTIKYFI